MAVLQILTIPDPRLKYKSNNIQNFDKNLEKIVDDMFDTLYASGNGIGLAAPQVNIHQRIIVMDLREDEKSNPQVFINPRIIKFSAEKNINEEGCLSIPEFYAEVERPSTVDVEWFDTKGKKIKKKMTGLLSICMQHEIDHLNGVLFIDHISKLKKKMALQKFKKLKTKK
ncbi:MAG: peptide deformylase [Rickettsiales bacterium]|nr:peptide deformylase [Rickettsiales bacterium]|tara:strand:+ start:150 stop:659 length:510 start_codon:yes stop_codon:yes gene_type:complete